MNGRRARRKSPVLSGDQQQAFDCIAAALDEGDKDICITLPAGPARAPIIAALAARRRRGERVLILSNRYPTRELARDLAGWLGTRNVATIATDGGRVSTRPVIVAAGRVQRSSVNRALEARPEPVALFILDEEGRLGLLAGFAGMLLAGFAWAGPPPPMVILAVPDGLWASQPAPRQESLAAGNPR